MNDQYIKLNQKIKELIRGYNFSENDLKLIFNFGNFITVTDAITKAYQDFKNDRDIDESDFVDVCYYVNDVISLDMNDNDIFINVESYYNPKHLTVDELRRIYDQLEHVKR